MKFLSHVITSPAIIDVDDDIVLRVGEQLGIDYCITKAMPISYKNSPDEYHLVEETVRGAPALYVYVKSKGVWCFFGLGTDSIEGFVHYKQEMIDAKYADYLEQAGLTSEVL